MPFTLIVIPFAAAGLLILLVAGVRAEPAEKGEDMIRNVYVYLVLFATLMMTIGGSVAAFMAVADIVAPAPTYHAPFEEYLRMRPGREVEEDLTEEELQARYESMIIQDRRRQVDRATNALIKSLGWIIIPLPVFLSFRRNLAKKDE